MDAVKTRKDFWEKGVRKGDIGTIVISFTTPNEAYEVEFVNGDGITKAIFAILPDDLEPFCR